MDNINIFDQLKNSLETEAQQENFELLMNGSHGLLPEQAVYLASLENIPQVEATYLRTRKAFNDEQISHRKYAEYSTLLHAIQKDLEHGGKACLQSLTVLKSSGELDSYKKLAIEGGQALSSGSQIEKLRQRFKGKNSREQIGEVTSRRRELKNVLEYEPHFNALEDLENRVYINDLLKDLKNLPPVLAQALVEQKIAAQSFNATRANTEYLFDKLLYSERRKKYTRRFTNPNPLYDEEIAHGYDHRGIVYTPGKELEYLRKYLEGEANVRKSGNNWREGFVFTTTYAEVMHEKSRNKILGFYEGRSDEEVKKAMLMWNTMFSLYDKKKNQPGMSLTKEERASILTQLADPEGNIDKAFREYSNLYKANPELFPTRAKWFLNREINLEFEDIVSEIDSLDEEDDVDVEEEVVVQGKKTDLINLMHLRRRVSRYTEKKQRESKVQEREKKDKDEDKKSVKGEQEGERDKGEMRVRRAAEVTYGTATHEAELAAVEKLKAKELPEQNNHLDIFTPNQIPNGSYVTQENIVWENNPLMSTDVHFHPKDIQLVARENDASVDRLEKAVGGKFKELAETLATLREGGEHDKALDMIYNYFETYESNPENANNSGEYYFLAEALINQYLSSSLAIDDTDDAYPFIYYYCEKAKGSALSMMRLDGLQSSVNTFVNLKKLHKARNLDRERGFQLPNIYKSDWHQGLEDFRPDELQLETMKQAMSKLRIIQYNSEASRIAQQKNATEADIQYVALGYTDFIFSVPSQDQVERDSIIGKEKAIHAEALMKFVSPSEYLYQGNSDYGHYFDVQLPRITAEIDQSLLLADGKYTIEDKVTNSFFVLQSEIFKLEYYAHLVAKDEPIDVSLNDLKDKIIGLQAEIEKDVILLGNEDFEKLAQRSRLVSSLKLINYSTDGSPHDSIRWNVVKPKLAEALVQMDQRLNRGNYQNDKLDQYVFDLFIMLKQIGFRPVRDVFRSIEEEGKLNSSKVTTKLDSTAMIDSQDQAKEEGDYEQEIIFRVINEPGNEKNDKKSDEEIMPEYRFKKLNTGNYLIGDGKEIWGDLPHGKLLSEDVLEIARNYKVDYRLEEIENSEFKKILKEIITHRTNGEFNPGFEKLSKFIHNPKKPIQLTIQDKQIFAYHYAIQYLSNDELLKDDANDESGSNRSSVFSQLESIKLDPSEPNPGIMFLRKLYYSVLDSNNWRKIDFLKGFQLPNIYGIDGEHASPHILAEAVDAIRFIRLGDNRLSTLDNKLNDLTFIRVGLTRFPLNRRTELLRIWQTELRNKKNELVDSKLGTNHDISDELLNIDLFDLQTKLYELEENRDFEIDEEKLEYRSNLKNRILEAVNSISTLANSTMNLDLKRVAYRAQLVSALKLLRIVDIQTRDEDIERYHSLSGEVLNAYNNLQNITSPDNEEHGLDFYILKLFGQLQNYFKE